jgi:hypothetical protein
MFNKLLSLEEIKEEPYVIEHIRWDIEPRLLMERTTGTAANGRIIKDTLIGYVFYIDNIDKKPVLSLMRHTAADYAETLAQIVEIPAELLKEAIEDGKDRVYFSMYPINKKIEAWLKKELGVAAD